MTTQNAKTSTTTTNKLRYTSGLFAGDGQFLANNAPVHILKFRPFVFCLWSLQSIDAVLSTCTRIYLFIINIVQ